MLTQLSGKPQRHQTPGETFLECLITSNILVSRESGIGGQVSAHHSSPKAGKSAKEPRIANLVLILNDLLKEKSRSRREFKRYFLTMIFPPFSPRPDRKTFFSHKSLT